MLSTWRLPALVVRSRLPSTTFPAFKTWAVPATRTFSSTCKMTTTMAPETHVLKPIPGSAEAPEYYYRTGGFHPVHLEELYDSRYRTIRKLGYGNSSTVWLARDEKTGRFVALKFCSAADTTTEQVSRYTRILLQETSPPAAVSPICPAMIDNFLVSGANGQHSVQVLEPLGPTLDVVVDQHYMASAYQGERFNIGHQRRLARRMVQILARLHEVDIVHSNLHIGSFAFRLGKSIQTATTDELDFYTRTQPWGNIFHLERKNCLPLDPQFPQYLVQPRPLEESFRLHLYGGSDRLAILGLRHARDSERGFPEYYELANDNSAPELVIRQGSPTKQSDIWALGCCIYHLIFCVSPFSYHNAEEDEEGPGYLLLDMIRRLGAMPESKPAHQEMSLPIVEDSSEYPIENSLAGLEDEGVSLPEVESLTRFLRRIFQYDPEKRPTARELLSDPWLLQD